MWIWCVFYGDVVVMSWVIWRDHILVYHIWWFHMFFSCFVCKVRVRYGHGMPCCSLMICPFKSCQFCWRLLRLKKIMDRSDSGTVLTSLKLFFDTCLHDYVHISTISHGMCVFFSVSSSLLIVVMYLFESICVVLPLFSHTTSVSSFRVLAVVLLAGGVVLLSCGS